ncbi:Ail/Lom family outer membrane beta-barrel protein [Xenorhabdus innexi]|uniref:Virulence membrane protein PagC n=1 Tax=Xenorhabdus innexi TaxID=290109 RepID=A0A1N6MRU7_9GAMM|nr:Ail/Lom family outer membrane beta-barrel protein [Xenorhabdus innexi]PHM38499.1 virulence membrane protein PagC [Xenorhabdus innexi]SIP71494.1 Virulence membrane protein pagC [Xenorhabdus innexi]
MKNVFLLSLLTSGLVVGSFAYADSQNASIGYAQSKVEDFKDIKGVNLKYRYEWDEYPVGVIGSVTYMKGDGNLSDKAAKANSLTKHKGDVKYTSFLVGPAYRVHPQVSLYGLIGLAYTDAKVDYEQKDGKGNTYRKKNAFAYGAGVEINPIDDFVINLGYEGSSFKLERATRSINGFNIGVGYRF